MVKTKSTENRERKKEAYIKERPGAALFPRSDRAEDESLDELNAVFLRRNKHCGCEDDDERKEEVEENEGGAVESLKTEAMETGERERFMVRLVGSRVSTNTSNGKKEREEKLGKLGWRYKQEKGYYRNLIHYKSITNLTSN